MAVRVMSAGPREIIERARKLGLPDYVPKPVAPARLISMLGRRCGRQEATARGEAAGKS
jgi:two-component SAPR family response regulator